MDRLTQETFVSVKTYWRNLEDVFSVTFSCLSRRTSARHNCNVSLWRCLEDFFKRTWRKRLANNSWRRFENVLKMSCKDLLKTSWRRIQDVCGRRIAKTSWRRLEDVLEKQICFLGRGNLRQKVQYQLLVGLPEINLLLFCGNIGEWHYHLFGAGWRC